MNFTIAISCRKVVSKIDIIGIGIEIGFRITIGIFHIANIIGVHDERTQKSQKYMLKVSPTKLLCVLAHSF